MKVTSAQANKLLRQLSDELSTLESREQNTRSFVAATSEDIESVRPEYDYSDTQEKIITLETKIRALKHAINTFNTTTVVPDFDMTIDMMLVYLPQLTHRKSRLARLKNALPKERVDSYSRNSALIEYRYSNYPIEKANEDYLAVVDELSRAQTALDYVNSTVTFDLDI